MHFYLIDMKSVVGHSKLELRFKRPEERAVPMREIVDHVFYATASFKGDIQEFKYQYVSVAVDSDFRQEDLAEQDKTKGKKFLRLNTFFDFADKNLLGRGKKQDVEHLIRFIFDSFQKPDMHFGRPQIVKELIQFMEADGPKHLYSTFFKEALV